MQRNMDVIRLILLGVEYRYSISSGALCANGVDLGIEGWDDIDIAYNAQQLIEAGYLKGNLKLASHGTVMILGMQWKGHDFLDSIRDPQIWERTKNGVTAAGGFTIDLLKELAKGFIKTQIEQRTGIKV